MLTTESFLADFERLYRAERAPKLQGTGFAVFAVERLRSARAAVLTTAEWLSFQFHGGAPTATLDLEPYVRRLDHYARLAHAQATPRQASSSINVAVSNVRFAVLAVRGWRLGQREGRGPLRRRESIPEGFRRLYDAVVASGATDAGQMIGLFADLMLDHGIVGDHAIPVEYEVVRDWSVQAGIRRNLFSVMLSRYRSAARTLGLPMLYCAKGPSDRGLRSLQNIDALIARSKQPHLDPRTAGPMALIKAVAPFCHGDLTVYVSGMTGTRAGWRERQMRSMDRTLASAIRLGVDVADLDTWDLYQVTVSANLLEQQGASGDYVQKRRDSDAPRGDRGQVEVPIMRAVVDECTRLSAQNSRFNARDSSHGAWYTHAVRADEANIFRCCTAAHALKSGTDSLGWERLQAVHKGIDLVTGQKVTLTGAIDRDLLLDAVTFPQAVALGIPYLTREALEYREMSLSRPTDGRVAAVYADLNSRLHHFIISLWDGLRPKNYVGALYGKHITPVRRNGKVVTFRTSFRGIEDEERCRLKKDHDEVDKSENSRTDTLPEALIHPLLATDYVDLHRVRALVGCGAVESLAGYDPSSDRFAFFATTRAVELSPGGHCPVPEGRPTGRYADETELSKDYGHTLYRIATEVLGRRLPEWDSPELKRSYHGLFAAHKGVRLLNASYWGGVREDWKYARWRTNDSLATLQKHYVKITEAQRMRLNSGVTGVEALTHFDELMDHLVANGVVDWSRFDPENPKRSIVQDRRPARAA